MLGDPPMYSFYMELVTTAIAVERIYCCIYIFIKMAIWEYHSYWFHKMFHQKHWSHGRKN